MIESFDYEGVTYYKSVYRGSEYHLRLSPSYEGIWECHSSRLALGSRNVGSTKFFKTLEEAEAKMKAFNGLGILVKDQEFSDGQKLFHKIFVKSILIQEKQAN